MFPWMKMALSLILFSMSSLTAGENHCCPIKTVGGNSSLAGVYTLAEEGPEGSELGEGCMDNCVYTRQGERFCFGSGPDYPVQCSKQDSPVTQVIRLVTLFNLISSAVSGRLFTSDNPLALDYPFDIAPVRTTKLYNLPGIHKIEATNGGQMCDPYIYTEGSKSYSSFWIAAQDNTCIVKPVS